MTAAQGVTRGTLSEHMIIGRVDWNLSDKQKIFVRISDDQGDQPTFVSVVNPLLNVVSHQPIWNGQLNHTYIFGPECNQSIYRFRLLLFVAFWSGQLTGDIGGFSRPIQ